jgi:hypothetical protein
MHILHVLMRFSWRHAAGRSREILRPGGHQAACHRAQEILNFVGLLFSDQNGTEIAQILHKMHSTADEQRVEIQPPAG